MSSSILVTGGAGYIGSHIVLALRREGFWPVVVDDLSSGRRELVSAEVPFTEGDCGDEALIRPLLRREGIVSVIHCAGRIRVDESVRDPLLYYQGNTLVSRNLIAACVAEKIPSFLFSSTAAVYGNPAEIPILEETPLNPVNPYGRSKLMTEMMLQDASMAYGLRALSMRYFNVAGADPDARAGQVIPFVSHLIRRALRVYLGEFPQLEIFGTDYPTPDGTCIRDYIHVSDLADAHVRGIRYLLAGGASRAVNCGYGHGFSVREVLRAVEAVTGQPLPMVESPRREGDPAALVAQADWLRKELGWTPKFDDLPTIIAHALAWEKKALHDFQ